MKKCSVKVLIAFLFPFRIPIFFRESETNNNNSPMNKTSQQSDGQAGSGDGAQYNASRRGTIVKGFCQIKALNNSLPWLTTIKETYQS